MSGYVEMTSCRTCGGEIGRIAVDGITLRCPHCEQGYVVCVSCETKNRSRLGPQSTCGRCAQSHDLEKLRELGVTAGRLHELVAPDPPAAPPPNWAPRNRFWRAVHRALNATPGATRPSVGSDPMPAWNSDPANVNNDRHTRVFDQRLCYFATGYLVRSDGTWANEAGETDQREVLYGWIDRSMIQTYGNPDDWIWDHARWLRRREVPERYGGQVRRYALDTSTGLGTGL